MSVWIDARECKPPFHEEVLILYKHRNEELVEWNLNYGIAYASTDSDGDFMWSHFVPYQGCYEVIYWAPLVDKPVIKRE